MKLVSVNASSTLTDSDVPNKAWIAANVGGGVSQAAVDAGDFKSLKYALAADTLFEMQRLNKLNGFYDDFATTDDYVLTGSTTVTNGVASGSGTLATKTTSLPTTIMQFYIFPIESLGTGSITYEYTKNGTTWTSASKETAVNVTGTTTTFQVRALLSGDARLVGCSIIY